VVFFGLYESLNDLEVARLLLEAVSDWGKRKAWRFYVVQSICP